MPHCLHCERDGPLLSSAQPPFLVHSPLSCPLCRDATQIHSPLPCPLCRDATHWVARLRGGDWLGAWPPGSSFDQFFEQIDDTVFADPGPKRDRGDVESLKKALAEARKEARGLKEEREVRRRGMKEREVRRKDRKER